MKVLTRVAMSAGLACATLAGQTMVETAIITGKASAAAAKLNKSLGVSAGSVLGKTGGSLAGAAHGSGGVARSTSRPVSASTVALPAPAKREPSRPLPSTSDFDDVKEGMSGQELASRLGPPMLGITGIEDGKLLESLDYKTKEGSTVKIRLMDGKVTSVRTAASR